MNYFLYFLFCLTLTSYSLAQSTDTAKAPSGYLYKVDNAIPGQTVYVCGERPFNANGNLAGSGNLNAQTQQLFENIKTSLATVGMTLKDITQIKYFVKGETETSLVSNLDSQQLKTVQTTYLTIPPKIVDMKNVGQTVRNGVLIEIEVIAIK